MASSIPVLNNNQMQRFRALLGQGRKIDLTNKLAAKNQRLPELQEDEQKEVVAADGQIIITISNTTNAAFTAGMAVAIDLSQAMAVPNVYPAKKIDETVNNPFGVCLAAIEPNATGDCIILGLAEVTITGSSGLFAKPNANGVFARGDEGVRVMGIASGTGKAIVMLGDYYEAPVTPPSPGGGDVPPGTIIAYAGALDDVGHLTILPDGAPDNNPVPSGWLYCNGQAVSRETYKNLFAVIGTIYGEGDGSTTFNVPNYRGSFLRGAEDGDSFAVVGYTYNENEDDPGSYVDTGVIDATGVEIKSGDAIIDGQTVSLAGATVSLSGIELNGTSYSFTEFSIVDYVEAAGAYIHSLVPLGEPGETQAGMGHQLHSEIPNITGYFWGLSVNGSTVTTDGDMGLLRRPQACVGLATIDNYDILKIPIIAPNVNPGVTGIYLYDNSVTLNNIQIDTTEDYKSTGVSVAALGFGGYYGQVIDIHGSNNMTVGEYIAKYGKAPPESLLTIGGPSPGGFNLPTRHLVHWLIKY